MHTCRPTRESWGETKSGHEWTWGWLPLQETKGIMGTRDLQELCKNLGQETCVPMKLGVWGHGWLVREHLKCDWPKGVL